MLITDARFRLDVGDVADAVPEGMRRRILTLRDRATDAIASVRAVGDQIDRQRAIRDDLEKQLRVHEAVHRPAGRPFERPQDYIEDEATAKMDAAARANARLTWVAPGDSSLATELKAKIDRAFQEIVRLQNVREPRNEIWHARKRLCQAVEDFLRPGGGVPRGCAVEPMPEPSPKLAKGEDLAAAIEHRRRRIREIDATIERVKSEPVLAADAKRRVSEYIDHVRETRAPSVERLLFGDDVSLPKQSMKATPIIQINPPILIGWEQVDVEGLLAFALGDIIVKKLHADIDTEMAALVSGGAKPMGDAERERLLASLGVDRVAIEHEEVALIEMAWASGQTSIEMRADTSPIAVLNASLVTRREPEPEPYRLKSWKG